MADTSGPFETFMDASQAARAALGGQDAAESLGGASNRRLLGRALEAAGVATGRYDDRIAEWLAGYEPGMVAVIAGWVERAHAAGVAAGQEHQRRTFGVAVRKHDELVNLRNTLREAIPADTLDGLADCLIRTRAEIAGPAAVPDIPERLKRLADLIRQGGTDGP